MATDKRVKGRGLTLHYLDTGGSGLPVVLLHGAMGRGACWQGVMERLSPAYRCIALDQRGHGASDKPQEGYTREDFVADLEVVVGGLRLDRFAIIGHSTGALNAWVYAARHPERVAAVVLEDMFAEPKGEAYMDGWRTWLAEWPVPFRDHAAVQAYFARLRPSLGASFSPLFEARADGWHPVFRTETILQTIAGNEAKPWWEELSQVQCPALVVKGGNSDFPLEEAQRMAEVLPKGRLEVIEGAWHTVHMDQPRAYLAAVESFLASALQEPKP